MYSTRVADDRFTDDSAALRAAGWGIYFGALCLIAQFLPPSVLTPGAPNYLLLIGIIALWRYSLGIVHFLRGMLFLHWIYPEVRERAEALGARARPSHAYFLVTSYRIEPYISEQVYRAVFTEARRCGVQATIVASIVEVSDEQLIRSLWDQQPVAPHVELRVIRIPGTGKRDALAQGFRSIAQDQPDSRAVVAVVDGDSVLRPGIIAKTAPFLALMPRVGALTTNEFCRVDGGTWITQWHRLRFAQRHLNMCSMALSRRVLTLTGRMSVFRASVVTRPEFIADIENDSLEHWRLGRFRFLTGDDKSSWFSLMRLGYDTYYVPDAAIDTLESPPSHSFFAASRQLMFRWYGNSLRQNTRAVRLGPGRLGAFTYYVLFDQRVSMWTSLLGICAAVIGSFKYGPAVFAGYLLWVGLSRLWMTTILRFSQGHQVSPAWPLLLWYNQIVGSVIKIYAFFHLDQQSWTRQKTVLHRDLEPFQLWFNRWSSRAMTFSACSIFAAILLHLV